MFPDPKWMAKANKASWFRQQYQARRDMFTALEAMHVCRFSGKLEKLIKIAEHELGVSYQIRPEKLMPRRIEFTLDICNLIGLAHLDKLKLPQSLERPDKLAYLATVLDVSTADKNVILPYVFGDQKTYRDPAKPDTSFLVFKRNINRLEERLKYSNVPVEKCHLYHEIGKQNLTQGKFDEARIYARRVVDEASEAGSYLWRFIGHILSCRADVMEKNIVKIYDSFKAAGDVVGSFANPQLSDVIASCLQVCEIENYGNRISIPNQALVVVFRSRKVCCELECQKQNATCVTIGSIKFNVERTSIKTYFDGNDLELL